MLTNDPTLGIFRHADAGYPEALETARKHDVTLPMIDSAAPLAAPAR